MYSINLSLKTVITNLLKEWFFSTSFGKLCWNLHTCLWKQDLIAKAMRERKIELESAEDVDERIETIVKACHFEGTWGEKQKRALIEEKIQGIPFPQPPPSESPPAVIEATIAHPNLLRSSRSTTTTKKRSLPPFQEEVLPETTQTVQKNGKDKVDKSLRRLFFSLCMTAGSDTQIPNTIAQKLIPPNITSLRTQMTILTRKLPNGQQENYTKTDFTIDLEKGAKTKISLLPLVKTPISASQQIKGTLNTQTNQISFEGDCFAIQQIWHYSLRSMVYDPTNTTITVQAENKNGRTDTLTRTLDADQFSKRFGTLVWV